MIEDQIIKLLETQDKRYIKEMIKLLVGRDDYNIESLARKATNVNVAQNLGYVAELAYIVAKDNFNLDGKTEKLGALINKLHEKRPDEWKWLEHNDKGIKLTVKDTLNIKWRIYS